MKKTLTLIMALLLTTLSFTAGAEAIYENITREQLTKGVLYEEIDTFTNTGWQRASVVQIDLENDDLEVKVLFPSSGSSGLATVKEMAEQNGTKAAINGDFFNFSSGETNMLGMVVSGGELVSTPAKDGLASFALTKDNAAIFDYFTFTGTLFAEKTSLVELSSCELYQINKMPLTTGAITMITSAWGDKVTIPIGNYAMICEPYGENQYKMVGLSWGCEAVAIPDGGAVFTANYEINGFLNLNFAMGDVIRVETTLTPDIPAIKESIGGNTLIVKDGAVCKFTNDITGKNPRTAIGVSADGKTLYLVAVQGRLSDCPGYTQTDLANFMIKLGCDSAINLDGGGSTTMVTENIYTGAQEVKNDITSLRKVSNAIGVVTHKKPSEYAATGEVKVSKNVVVPGDSVLVSYAFYDQNHNRIPGVLPHVQTSDKSAEVTNDYKIIFKTPGTHTVSVAYQDIAIETEVTVLDDIFSISIAPQKISATDGDKSFSVTAYDRNGFSASVPASLVKFSSSKELTLSGNTVKKTKATGTVTATYKGLTANAVVNGETYLRADDKQSEDAFFGTLTGGKTITVCGTMQTPKKYVGILQARKFLQSLGDSGDVYATAPLADDWNYVKNYQAVKGYGERTVENSKIVTVSMKNSGSIRLTDSSAWGKIKTLCQSAGEKNIIFILDTKFDSMNTNEKTVWNYCMELLTSRGKNVFVISPDEHNHVATALGVRYLYVGSIGNVTVDSALYGLEHAKPLRLTLSGDSIRYAFE